MTDLVRDAMVAEPPTCDAGASAQAAGEELARPEVRAVFVVEDGRLIGVVTRKTLVREVVAPGLDPKKTSLRDIAEEPLATLQADLPLEEAFQFVEEQELERVPVVEADGHFVGVLSRAVVQRRLAEDRPPEEDEELYQPA
ncbi:MAG: CBS domain-containing protein [Gaiellaceae bacterium]